MHNWHNYEEYFKYLPVIKESLICNLMNRFIVFGGSRYLPSSIRRVERETFRASGSTIREKLEGDRAVHMRTKKLFIYTRLVCPGILSTTSSAPLHEGVAILKLPKWSYFGN